MFTHARECRNTRYRLASILVILQIVNVVSVVGYAATIEELREAWQNTPSRFRTLQYECESTRAGRDLDALREDLGQIPRKGQGPVPKSERTSFSFTLSGDFAAYTGTTQEFDPEVGREVPRTLKTSFNGTETKTLYPNRGKPRGKLTDGKIPGEDIGNNSQVVPLWLAHSPLRLLAMKNSYDIDKLAITDANAYVEGRPCIEVSIPAISKNRDLHAQLLVEPAQGFRIVTMKEIVRGSPRIEHNIFYSDHPKLENLVSGWRSTVYSSSGDPALQTNGKIVAAHVNERIDPSIFNLVFPVGTSVLKIPEGGRLNDGRRFIQIDRSGTLQPVEQYHDQDSTPLSATRNMRRQSGTYRNAALTFTASSVFLIGLAIVRKHWRARNGHT